ncbi:hypothetical protein PVT67_04775 [Gallaecimonas kandeliae]|uniref:hypothetical protein n=1 Tax=Gallaecimonas kandeliae TaxID=3029055 RepID=UPI0026475137|nr:hypothetical protein [Gallaecimonas kandeliae]WKE66568.1 hypothetical protein PVT67_04775 [Gallaecimonas kandeliae]
MANPLLYWTVSTLLLLWGLAYAGLVFFSFVLAKPAHWAALVAKGRIQAEYADYIAAIPGWVVLLTAAAAASRLLGALALFWQSAWAFTLYGLSLFLVVIIMFRAFALAKVARVIRPSQVALELAFLLISVFAAWFSAMQILNGVLR